jgi:chemotaxis protein cheW
LEEGNYMANAGGLNKKAKVENDDLLKLVTFQLGEELYGVEIMDVDQIVRVQDVRPIPNAPYYVEGIFNLRSEIIPVISLHKRFHIKKASLDEGDEFLGGFIIIKVENNKIGIIIDRVARVVDVKKEEIQPPPQMIAGIGAEYINGVVRRDPGYLIILDIHRLFNPKELQKITNL